MVRRSGNVKNAQRNMLFNLIGKHILRLVALENIDVIVAPSSLGNKHQLYIFISSHQYVINHNSSLYANFFEHQYGTLLFVCFYDNSFHFLWRSCLLIKFCRFKKKSLYANLFYQILGLFIYGFGIDLLFFYINKS
jgi:hypothetical protein